ncbi:MAG TPA: hypothetical protein PLO59_00115 [Bacteroidia bacterium]|nr:hypothetical protein [Bacteroidia bacterium]
MLRGKENTLKWFDYNAASPIWQIAASNNPNQAIIGWGVNDTDEDDPENKKAMMDPGTSRGLLEEALNILEPGSYTIRLRKSVARGSKWLFTERIDTRDQTANTANNPAHIGHIGGYHGKTEAEIRADERAKVELEFKIKELERLLKEKNESGNEKISGVEKLIPLLQPHMGHIIEGLFGKAPQVAVSGFDANDSQGTTVIETEQTRLENALQQLNEHLEKRGKNIVAVLESLNHLANTQPATFDMALNFLK